MTTISLITDFGLKDGNVGVMKAVILGIAPQAKIVDLSHLIAPQAIAEAAIILARSAPYFLPGSVHLVVVDPGVGTARRPLAARLGEQFFVGPDNGVVTMLLEQAETLGSETQFNHLNRSQFWRTEVSHVFHGRDIFAPVAAHLANGVPLQTLGTPISNPVRLAFSKPEPTPFGWRGEVIHIDHFGNVATNIRREHLPSPAHPPLTARLRGVKIGDFVQTFGERQPGALVALLGSTGNLIFSVVNGSAAQRLGAQVGDAVEVEIGH